MKKLLLVLVAFLLLFSGFIAGARFHALSSRVYVVGRSAFVDCWGWVDVYNLE